MAKPPVIGLCGYKGVGKGEVRKILENWYGYAPTKMATPLKNMLRALLYAQGVHPSVVERMIEGDLKEHPSVYLNGNTPRFAMQTLGVEWGRNLIGYHYWVDSWARSVKNAKDRGDADCFVVDDVRFPNEVDMIVSEMKGQTWLIKRDGVGETDAHVTEKYAESLRVDIIIENDGDLADLTKKVRTAMDVDIKNPPLIL